jgi:hypothetical protein
MPTEPTLPAPLAEYLKSEIPPLDLANLLDAHLHDVVRLIAATGEAWNEEQLSSYHHIRRLRDLIVELSGAKPIKP